MAKLNLDGYETFKKSIIAALRSLSYKFPMRKEAKDLQKVAPATYECEICGIYMYEGDKELSKVDKIRGKEYIAIKPKMDHIAPIVPVEGFKRGSWDWHEYIERMFCPVSGWQCICPDCHTEKTRQETAARVLTRKLKKGKISPNEEII